jgi:hypothetical protein
MAYSIGTLEGLVERVEQVGRSVKGRQAAIRWAVRQEALGRFEDAADLAREIRQAPPADGDQLIAALLRVAASDELAQLVVVAGLAGRLGSVLAVWGRAGATYRELLDAEADLAAECWVSVADAASRMAAGNPAPSHPGQTIVDAARERVRVARRRLRRVAARHVPLATAGWIPAPDTTNPATALTSHLIGTVRAGYLTASAAGLVLATRVAGWTVTETAARLGTTPQSVRALRNRAERRLIAAA